jgi:anaerobic selenocysteine-containing dehydrogenase
MNPDDASKKGIKTSDEVYIESSSAKVKAKVLVTPGIKPGVVGANFSFGHQAYGSRAVQIDGKMVEPPKKYSHLPFDLNTPLHEETGYAGGRGNGFSVNALTERDDSYFEGFLVDPIAGGPAQQDVFVDIRKA